MEVRLKVYTSDEQKPFSRRGEINTRDLFLTILYLILAKFGLHILYTN